jgi:acyl-CoA synthetase (AMP-forming)/AMP-acid ligase II
MLDPRNIVSTGLKLAERLGDEAYFAALCLRSGMVGVPLPHQSAQILVALERYGLLGGAVTAGAIRFGDRTAIVDERGELTYKELDGRSNAIANCWREDGLKPGEGVAILARNHRGFFDAVFAAAKCGARVVLLNTSFAGPQIREVAEREGTDLLVCDEEYQEALEGIDEPPRGRYRAWADTDGDDTLAALAERGDPSRPPKAGATPKITILTSGTTGSPKGAPRSEPRSLGLLGGLLSKVPFRAGEVTEMCVPAFHALGFMQAMVGIGLGSTLVVRRRFDPEQTLDSLERHKATAMVVVPVMLQRILDVGEDKIRDHDLSNLRIIFVSGSALGVEVTKRSMKAFGPVIYNLYGSTEISYATIATPKDLKEEPGSVGKVVRGSVVKIYDDEGKKELPQGETGRIFVGNLSQFEGYTGGGSKDEVDGLMASGDVGHFDKNGRLFIEGRDDEMIVSGGENVFPAEVEELLAGHEAVEETAVIGVDDEKFGQRLKAFVVLRSGAELSEDEAKDYVKQNLAGYKTPREVVFLDELPRNSTGKVLKRELAERDDDSESDKGESKPQSKSSGNGDRSGNGNRSSDVKSSRTNEASSRDKTS